MKRRPEESDSSYVCRLNAQTVWMNRWAIRISIVAAVVAVAAIVLS